MINYVYGVNDFGMMNHNGSVIPLYTLQLIDLNFYVSMFYQDALSYLVYQGKVSL